MQLFGMYRTSGHDGHVFYRKLGKYMKFKDFSLIGFSQSQVKRIRRKYNPEDEVGMNLTQDIADLTGYSVGLVFSPGEPLKIIRLDKEV